jgi:hypothetical protein
MPDRLINTGWGGAMVESSGAMNRAHTTMMLERKYILLCSTYLACLGVVLGRWNGPSFLMSDP